jgi:hypothetical protein
MAALATIVPLAVLAATSDGSDAMTDQTCNQTRWRLGRWMRWFDLGDSDAIDEMATKLNLTEEETATVKQLAQEANDLRQQLKDKMDQIREIVGPKMEALRQSSGMPCMPCRPFGGPRVRWGCCGRWAGEIPPEEPSAEES